jgi:hypothetical protein
MAGWLSTKHVGMLKLAMVLGMMEYPPLMVLTPALMTRALSFVNQVEKNLAKLFAGAGRSDLALPMQQLIDRLEANDGWMPEKILNVALAKDMTPDEIWRVKKFMEDNSMIIIKEVAFPKCSRMMVMTPEKHRAKLLEMAKQVVQQGNGQPPQP